MVGNLTAMIEPVLGSMGYELVDIEHGVGGLLRVTIDVADGSRFIRVEDCEQVSHQLNRLLTVEEVDYARLEISSPGLDRPLRRESDFVRFTGERVSLRLRQAVAGRRQFTGVLQGRIAPVDLQVGGQAGSQSGSQGAGTTDAGSRWLLLWSDEPPALPPGTRARAGVRRAQRLAASRRLAPRGRTEVPVAGGSAAVGSVAMEGTVPVGDGRLPVRDENAADRVADDGSGSKVGEGAGQRRLVFTLDQVEKARLVPKLAF